MIFVEHSKLLKENELLHELINSLNEVNLLLLVSDSIKSKQISLYTDWNSSLLKDNISKLKRIIKWESIGITTSILLLLNLFIK